MFLCGSCCSVLFKGSCFCVVRVAQFYLKVQPIFLCGSCCSVLFDLCGVLSTIVWVFCWIFFGGGGGGVVVVLFSFGHSIVCLSPNYTS
jgi:hypothetical protein